MELRESYGRVRRHGQKGEKRREGDEVDDKENQSPSQPTKTEQAQAEEDESSEQTVKEDPRVLLQRYFKQHALRPVLKVSPGRLPFRHDPVERNRQYKLVWGKNPLPHEQRRLSLRWQIRDMMCRRDWIKLRPAALGEQERVVPRPDWVD